MMKFTILRGVLLLLVTTGVVSASSTYLSMLQLIANPKQYDQQHVRVVGFLHVSFEGNALYLTQNDAEHSVTKNALWVDGDDEVDIDRNMHKKYVFIEGVFDAAHHGHLQLYSGRLRIERMIVWGDHQ